MDRSRPVNVGDVRVIAGDLTAGLLDLIYPPRCLLCGEFGEHVLCEACAADLIVPVPPPYCLRCGQVQSAEECSKCLDYPAGLVRCRAVGVLEGKLADAIHQLKYRERPMLAKPLAELMANYLLVRAEIMNDLKFDAIVPVPLHKRRERERGYNQSERLARELGKVLSIETAPKALSRVVNTSPQVGKHRPDRQQNLKNAFRGDPFYCRGKTLLLVDDVSTTGSTLSECARALLFAGASSVYAIALAAG